MNTPEELMQYKVKRLEHLRASTFVFSDYTPPSNEAEHNHCEGCWAKFATLDRPGILRRGYFTTMRTESAAKPDAKVWICPKCFEEFRVTLAWKLESRKET